MKKIFIVLAAVAMLASCQEKRVVVYNDANNEIGINVVNKKSVKSVFSTAIYGESHDFTVWANLNPEGEADETDATAYTIAYLDAAPFTYRYATHPCYGGPADDPYYWPKNGALMFAGVHPEKESLMTNFSVKKVDYKFANDSLSITNFTQPDPQADSTDCLMFFPRTKSYVESENHVAAAFQHTQSWLTFKVWAKTEAANKYYTVDSIVVNAVNKRADLAVKTTGDASTIEWTACVDKAKADTSNIVVVKTNANFNPYWEEEIDPSGAKIVEDYNNSIIVIPQTTTTATVTFSYTTQAGQKVTETKDFSLSSVQDGDKWKPGHHYTYVISFDLKEILIDPTVTPWVEVEGNTLNI